MCLESVQFIKERKKERKSLVLLSRYESDYFRRPGASNKIAFPVNLATLTKEKKKQRVRRRPGLSLSHASGPGDVTTRLAGDSQTLKEAEEKFCEQQLGEGRETWTRRTQDQCFPRGRKI